MRFYWVRDRVEQKHFEVKCKLGHMGIGDYFTRHHPPTHHRSMPQTWSFECLVAKELHKVSLFVKKRVYYLPARSATSDERTNVFFYVRYKSLRELLTQYPM